MSTPTKLKSSSDRESYWSVPIPIPKPKIGLEYRFPNPNTTGAKSEIRKTIRKRIDVASTDTDFLYISLSNHYSFIQFYTLE